LIGEVEYDSPAEREVVLDFGRVVAVYAWEEEFGNVLKWRCARGRDDAGRMGRVEAVGVFGGEVVVLDLERSSGGGYSIWALRFSSRLMAFCG
jgi:hypothetical protein